MSLRGRVHRLSMQGPKPFSALTIYPMEELERLIANRKERLWTSHSEVLGGWNFTRFKTCIGLKLKGLTGFSILFLARWRSTREILIFLNVLGDLERSSCAFYPDFIIQHGDILLFLDNVTKQHVRLKLSKKATAIVTERLDRFAHRFFGLKPRSSSLINKIVCDRFTAANINI